MGDYRDYHESRGNVPWSPTETYPTVDASSVTYQDQVASTARTEWIPTSPHRDRNYPMIYGDASNYLHQESEAERIQREDEAIAATLHYEQVRAHTAYNQREVTYFATEYNNGYAERLNTYYNNLREHYAQGTLTRERIITLSKYSARRTRLL